MAIQLPLVAESCTICSSCSWQRKLLDTPSCILLYITWRFKAWVKRKSCENWPSYSVVMIPLACFRVSMTSRIFTQTTVRPRLQWSKESFDSFRLKLRLHVKNDGLYVEMKGRNFSLFSYV